MLKRILPEIGHIKLDKLQPHHIVELNNSLSGHTNRRGIAFLATHEFFDAFEETGLMRDWLTLKLLQLLKKETVMFRTMIKLFIYSGLRRRELCGSEWKDSDINTGHGSLSSDSRWAAAGKITIESSLSMMGNRSIQILQFSNSMIWWQKPAFLIFPYIRYGIRI